MKALKTKRRFVLLCVLTVLLALIIWTAWGNTALMVNTISVSSDRIPAGFSGYRIAQVSDLHNAEFGAGNTKLLQTISENTPNIIVITGDLIDMNHTNMDTVLDFVKNAVQIAPIYYVTGNHEAALSQYDELKEGLKSVGVIVLEDEAIQLEHNGSSVTLIGLSDPNFAIRNDVFDETPAMVSTKEALIKAGKGEVSSQKRRKCQGKERIEGRNPWNSYTSQLKGRKSPMRVGVNRPLWQAYTDLRWRRARVIG